jgi:predicted signal transduction protein with EAL and GGDEF domain
VTSVPGLSYAFQPMLSTRTGRLLALEALARPDTGGVHDVLRDAARAGRLVEVDAGLAAGAIRAATTPGVPLHVNVLARTLIRMTCCIALNPLTRLPGTGTVAGEIERRIGQSEMFVVSWLDVDSFKRINDTKGFAAGDDLIRAIGRTPSGLAARLPGTRVAHVGGDDFLVVTAADEVGTLVTEVVDRLWTAEGATVSVSLASLMCGAGRWSRIAKRPGCSPR